MLTHRPDGPRFLQAFPYEGQLGRLQVLQAWVKLLQTPACGFPHGREFPDLLFYSCFSGEGNGNHSSALAWRTPWLEEPGGLQCMSHLLKKDLIRISKSLPPTPADCILFCETVSSLAVSDPLLLHGL